MAYKKQYECDKIVCRRDNKIPVSVPLVKMEVWVKVGEGEALISGGVFRGRGRGRVRDATLLWAGWLSTPLYEYSTY